MSCFVCFSSLILRSVGEEKWKVGLLATMSDHTSFPILISHHAITKILDFLHISITL